MQLSDFISAFFSWIFGLIGMLALIAGLAFLPELFGYEQAGSAIFNIGEITLSKGILFFFNFPFGISALVVATALFVWVSLLFSMSSYELVEAAVGYLKGDLDEGVLSAWIVVLCINFVLVSLYVFVLFGKVLSPATLLIGGLMMLAMAALLAANYRETYKV